PRPGRAAWSSCADFRPSPTRCATACPPPTRFQHEADRKISPIAPGAVRRLDRTAGRATGGRAVSLLGDDDHLHRLHHLGVVPHRPLAGAGAADGLLELDLPAVDLDVLGGELLGDVERGDRAVELVLLAHLAGDRELDAG